ncbi:MAG TPA: sigma-70 family RNA polymerase sigma factor [Solirubrobacteraceae bacterium]|nr:sigma-70 family RNA polymerase sigma factor [Solirubrobacteraceae bacterium]
MQSDSRLASLARDGRERAFGVLIERYRPELLRYARRHLRREEAEDAVQQCLLAAWEALSGGTEVRRVRGWLYQILRHAIAAAHEQRQDEALPAQDLADPRETAAIAEEQARIRGALEALAQLPPAQRFALMQTELEAMSRKEIAASLQISESAVRGLVFRARSTLRQLATALTPALLLRWAAQPRPRCHLAASVGQLTERAGAHAVARTGAASAGAASAAATAGGSAGTGLGGSMLGAGVAAKAAVALLGVAAAVGGALSAGVGSGGAGHRTLSAGRQSALLARAPGADRLFASRSAASAAGVQRSRAARAGGQRRMSRPPRRQRSANRRTAAHGPAPAPAPLQAAPQAPAAGTLPSPGVPIARESAEGDRRRGREQQEGGGDQRSASTPKHEARSEEGPTAGGEAEVARTEETTVSTASAAESAGGDETTTTATSSDG